MKETLKRLLCLVMAMAMVFALVACGETAETKDDDKKEKTSNETEATGEEAGETEEEPEETEEATEETEEETEPEEEVNPLVGKWTTEINMAGALAATFGLTEEDVEGLELPYVITMEFDEDGTVTMTSDANKLADGLEEMLVVVALYAYAESTGTSVEEVAAALDAEGVTEEDLLKAMGMDEMREEMVAELNKTETGEWELDGDQLYIDGDNRTIDLDGDEFTVNFADAMGMDEDDVDMEVTFVRQ